MVLTRNATRAHTVTVKSIDGGVRVLRERVDVVEGDVERITAIALNGQPIFNPDSKRIQNCLESTDPLVARIVTALRDERILDGRVVGDVVALHSFAGCERQRFHTDYDPNRVRSSLVKPFGVIVALENSTRFLLIGSEIALNRGDVLIFDGDVVHAGADYEIPNTRVHLYVDYEGLHRFQNTTYFARVDS